MAEKYERMQKKTFQRWANKYLAERNDAIKDLYTDLSDGTKLHNLFEVIGGEKIRPFNKKPRMKIQRIENLQACLKFIQSRGVKLVGISAESIESGNKKLILGLLWSVILRFCITGSDGGAKKNAKKELLKWVNRRICEYEDAGVQKVKNFDKSWKDGKALSALTDSLQKGIIDMTNLNDPEKDVQNAIDTAEELFNIVPMVDAEDVVAHPDSHSMMTYISYFREYIDGDVAAQQAELARRKQQEDEAKQKKEDARLRALEWRASGPGLEKGFRNRTLPFILKPSSDKLEAHSGEFQVMIKSTVHTISKEAECLVGTVHEGDQGKFDGTWKSQDIGDHIVEITLGGYPIANTPFTVSLSEPSSFSESYAEGPGLKGARDDQSNFFVVYCRDRKGNPVLGEDTLEISIDYADGNKEIVDPTVTNNGDGSFSVQYEAKRPGDVSINVMIASQNIKEMPINLHVHSGAELDALIHEIEKLRKNLKLPKMQYTDEEVKNNPLAIEDLTKKRDDMCEVEQLVDEIQTIRKQLGLTLRQFEEDDLTGDSAISDRTEERDEMKELLAQKQKVDPLVAQIQKLRIQMQMSERKFEEEDLIGADAEENRMQEIEDLEEILPIYNDINELRKKLKLPKRQYEDVELDHFQNNQAIPDRIRERRKLKASLAAKNETDPLVGEIQKLRRGLYLEPREFTEEELTGPSAVVDRIKERDTLKDVAKLVDEIQQLRKKLDLSPKDFTEDELTSPTALNDLVEARDHLKSMLPLVNQIHDLRKQLELPRKEYHEEEITGPGTVAEREKERDSLLLSLSKKRLIDPLIAEIQKLRNDLELPEKEFTDNELRGETAVADRTEERDNLKSVIPLVAQIADLRKQLDMKPREYYEDELTGRTQQQQQEALSNRKQERDNLLDQVGTKQEVDPILEMINKLRRLMELEEKEWTSDQKKDIKSLINERDSLKQMLELYNEIHDLRKQLGWQRKSFEEEELTEPGSILDRTKERDELRLRLNRKRQTDPLAMEIQRFHQVLGLAEREFTEDELTGPTSIKDRIKEKNGLEHMVELIDDIGVLRKNLEMNIRVFDEDELASNDEEKRDTMLEDRRLERNALKQMQPLVEEIQDLRKNLEMPRRDFDDFELYGGTSLDDRTAERDELREKRKRKRITDPIVSEINKLRKHIDLEPKEYLADEIMGENAIEERTAERDQLSEVVPLFDEIQRLCKQLNMPHRDYDESELTSFDAIPDRKTERDDLLEKLRRSQKTSPLINEIQKLRRRMDLEPKEFREDEIYGPTSIEDRKDERDQLKAIFPLYTEINKLRKKLEMPVREFEEDELTGNADALYDRTDERDDLLAKYKIKNQLGPIMRQIQKYRNQLEVPSREFDDDELADPNAVENLTTERNNLKAMIPLADQIQRLRKKLERPPREFDEDELCGQNAVPERTEERDELRDMLARKKEIDPVLMEIQKLRRNLGLSPREFSDEEIFGLDAFEERKDERDQLRAIIPLVTDIGKLRKKLNVSPREYEESELCGAKVLHDLSKEKSDLEEVSFLCDEIQDLRKQLDFTPRKFEEDDLVGPTALEDREAERDELGAQLDRKRHLQPLIDELQELRRELDMPPREFEDGELEVDDADEMLQREIDELKNSLNRREDADKLAKEIKDLRKELNMKPRRFTEEELDAPDAIHNLTKERNKLRDELQRKNAIGDLPEQIQTLRKMLGYPRKIFPDPIPIEMAPELEEERDDLADECDERKKKAQSLLDKIGKLWNYLAIPRSDRAKLDLGKKEVPSTAWLEKAEKEHDRLKEMMRAQLLEEVSKQKDLLSKLWDELQVPEDQRIKFYHDLGDLFTEEGLQAIRDEVHLLHSRMKSSKKIIKLIKKRKKFIEEMEEFEVRAQDPKRLVGNSLILAKEEHFRATAYPSLLKLEEVLRNACVIFEDNTKQGFMWQGKYYLHVLEKEIENRGVNLNVFGVGGGQEGRKRIDKKKKVTASQIIDIQKKASLKKKGSLKKRNSGDKVNIHGITRSRSRSAGDYRKKKRSHKSRSSVDEKINDFGKKRGKNASLQQRSKSNPRTDGVSKNGPLSPRRTSKGKRKSNFRGSKNASQMRSPQLNRMKSPLRSPQQMRSPYLKGTRSRILPDGFKKYRQ